MLRSMTPKFAEGPRCFWGVSWGMSFPQGGGVCVIGAAGVVVEVAGGKRGPDGHGVCL